MDQTATSAAQRLHDLLEEIELADEVGLDVFGVGEHHRPDFAVSSPAVVLANQRFLIQLTVGPMRHAKVMRAIELLGTQVAPVVRREAAAATTPTESAAR